MIWRISNVKVSLKTSEVILDNVWDLARKRNLYCRDHGNYVVFKDIYTYGIFNPNSITLNNHVNITKIKSVGGVNHAVDYFCSLFNCSKISLVIDNISASTCVNKKLNLRDIVLKKKFEKSKNFIGIKYNNQIFPALFIRYTNGTLSVFGSGKINIIGCKKESDVECLIQNIYALT